MAGTPSITWVVVGTNVHASTQMGYNISSWMLNKTNH